MPPDESTVDSFEHLVGVNYFNDDTDLEFTTTRIAEYNGMIVTYRAPVLLTDRTGREEKPPMYVADIIRMEELNIRLAKSLSCGAQRQFSTGGLPRSSAA